MSDGKCSAKDNSHMKCRNQYNTFVSHLVRPRFPVSPNLVFRKLKGIKKSEHINCGLRGENEGLKEMKHVVVQ